MTITTNESDWLVARIAKTRATIEALEDCILAIATGAQMYQLDTGQTRQLVTRANVSSVRMTLAAYEARLRRLCATLNGTGGATIMRPAF